jgi:hypothetical protein
MTKEPQLWQWVTTHWMRLPAASSWCLWRASRSLCSSQRPWQRLGQGAAPWVT